MADPTISRRERREQMIKEKRERDMRLARERRQQTIVGIIVVLIVIGMLGGIAVTAFNMSNHASSTSQNQSAKTDKSDGLESLMKELKPQDIPSASNKLGGIVVGKDGYNKPTPNVPIIAVYSDPLCPGCGNFNRQADATLIKLMRAGQINLELHPMSFLDKLSTDHYSSRVAGALFYIASHDKDPEHLLNFTNRIFAEDFQPSEGSDYKPVDNKRLIALATEAGVPNDVATKAFTQQYTKWQTIINAATPNRKELWNVSGSNAGAMTTPTCTINNVLLDMNTVNQKNLNVVDAILTSIGLEKSSVGVEGKTPALNDKDTPRPLA